MRRTAATFALAVATLLVTAPGAGHLERTPVGDGSVATDPVYGPLIGLERYTPKDYVKLGKLSAKWVHEWNASFLVQVAD
jgi:hypothetical protein